MTKYAKQYLCFEAIVNGLINAVYYGGLTWLHLRGGGVLSWEGVDSFVPDIMFTCFALPFFLALIIIPFRRDQLYNYKLSRLQLGENTRFMFYINLLPKYTLFCAAVFGLIGLCVISPVLLASLAVFEVTEIGAHSYIIWKTLGAGILAAIFVVPMAAYSLERAPVL